MNSLIVAVDAGKSYTKCLAKIDGNLERLVFRTKVKDVQNLGVDIHDFSYLMEYNERNYLIGDMVDESEVSYDVTKTSIVHKVAIYLALGLVLQKYSKYDYESISLVIGAPLNIYKNANLKADYINYIQGDKNINIKINGSPVNFKIENILVLPESIGPIYKDVGKFKDKNVIVFDIGGLNVNISSYRDRIPELGKMVICNKGINILRAKIAEVINTQYGIIVDDKTADDIIKDGMVYKDGCLIEESNIFIKEIVDNHIREIINYSKSRSYNPFNTNAHVIFSGGGSILLRNSIKTLYPTAIIEEDAQYANVKSFYNVGEIKLG